MNLCTGNYMNYYSNGLNAYNLLIIINEGNGEATSSLDVSILEEADKICTDFCKDKKMTFDECKELELLLEEKVFPYGVQIFKR